jgi:outer membrane beta-barrel protein
MRREISQLFGPLALALALLGAFARAEESSLVEKTAVRNRLFVMRGKWEVGVHAGLPIVSGLTDTFNFNLSVAHNPLEWLAVELRGGYAFSFNNSVARDAAVYFFQKDLEIVDELPGAWRMGANAVVGARFQPIYGKVNVASDLPVHFQVYLWAGGGVAWLSRTSPTLCLWPSATNSDPNACVITDERGSRVQWSSYHREGPRLSPVVSLALGFRLLFAQRHSVVLEARSWSYPDAYSEGVIRANVTQSDPTSGGHPVANPGFIHLGQVDLGYVLAF